MSAPGSPPEAGRLPPLIVVTGGTGTGKTELSLRLADALGGPARVEIISADSRQVYRGMDVGTAKATRAERARVPHHGLDLVDPDVPFSVADYVRHAARALHAIAGAGRAALLVGGTGLYLRAVAMGLSLEPGGADRALRAELEGRLVRGGPAALVEELLARAPRTAAVVDLRNPRRVVRALERAILLGDRPPEPGRGYRGPVAWLGLTLDAAEHERRIVRRARQQFAGGLLEEAAELRETYPEDLAVFSALGYREAFAVLRGQLTLDEAVARTALRTRQYARRQRTWFRREPQITWLDASAGDPLRAALVAARSMLEEPRPR